MVRRHARSIAKAIFAVALLTYVVRAGAIDFSKMGKALLDPASLFLNLGSLCIVVTFICLRWQLLSRAQNMPLPFWRFVEFSMISSFFGMFFAGSVTGDAVKAWYVAGETPDRRSRAIFTVFVDRLISSVVVVGCAALALAVFPEWLDAHAELRGMAYILWSGCIFGAIVAGTLAWRARQGKAVAGTGLIARTERAFLFVWERPGTLLLATLYSAGSIAMTVALYFFQGRLIGIPVSFSQYLFIVPVSLIVSYLSFIPFGIGAGQVVFYVLFGWVAGGSPAQGATLCTLMQTYSILFNGTLGSVFYLRYRAASSAAVAPANLKRVG